VPGSVRKVFKNLGEAVHAGETMAVIDSRELADAKAAYLAALRRVDIAKMNLKREEELFKKKISPELDYLEAKRAFDEANIELRSAEQKLHAIGFSEEYLASLPAHPDVAYTQYEIKAPINGTVIEKHTTLGEVLKDDTTAFVIADLSSVWVNINVYQKDMPFVHKGQSVMISAGGLIPDSKGIISYVSPISGEETRTAVARVVLPNPKGILRPGLFVTAKVVIDDVTVPLLTPKTALITEGEQKQVFVETPEGFKLKPVTIGKGNDTHVEITSGMKPGEKYVSKGAFTLKAQLQKGAFGEGHGH
jgi:cobalt-zinc-cadmium efflux system membrane fusion protein